MAVQRFYRGHAHSTSTTLCNGSFSVSGKKQRGGIASFRDGNGADGGRLLRQSGELF